MANEKLLPGIEWAGRTEPIALSYPQDRYWLLSLLEPKNAAYNSVRALRLRGPLDIDTLKRATDDLFAQHEALRAYVGQAQGKPVLACASAALPGLELSQLDATVDRDVAAKRLVEELRGVPFDLTAPPLVRVVCASFDEHDHVLVVVAHRIMLDEPSFDVALEALGRRYSARMKGTAVPAEPAQLQFPDFAKWQCAQAHGDGFLPQLDFWKAQLAGELPILELPCDFARPARTTYLGRTLHFRLTESASAGIDRMAANGGSRRFDVILAALFVVLRKHTGQNELMVGTPAANRVRQGTEDMIGRLATVLPIRLQAWENVQFRSLLTSVTAVREAAFAHQELPFERLMEDLPPHRDLSRHPLFQLFVQEHSTSTSEFDYNGVSVERIELEPTSVMFDIEFGLRSVGSCIDVSCVYNSALFSQPNISGLLGHLEHFLIQIAEGADAPIDESNIIPEAERERLLTERNSATQPLPAVCLVHRLFEEQAERTPERVALVCGENALTFRELNARANQLARYLVKLGITEGDRVGICVDRSLEMIVSILAAIKAGGTYVPIDPAYPEDRQSFMVDDADVRFVLTQSAHAARLPQSGPVILSLDTDAENWQGQGVDNLEERSSSEPLLYMIFTSGSTGRPKGSLVYHRGFVNLLKWYQRELKFGESSTVLVYSSLSFDLTQKNLFVTLISGGTLVLLDTSHYDAERILSLISRHRATLVNCTPSAFYGLLANGSDASLSRLASLKYVVLGGEPISTARMRQWIESPHFNATFVNSYGPTECTDVVAFHCVTEPRKYGAPIPIGRPVPNTELYVLDDQLKLVPEGAPGELCIGGICVGAGYVKRAELNAEKFVPHPFSSDPAARIYRTGDRVRYLPTGEIDFLGRVDHQVKLRGYRIELGEIVSRLERCPEVREVYVMAREDDRGEQALVAYFVPAGASSEGLAAVLRKQLLESLPEYMVPTSFVAMEKMPLTPNGKVDRGRLPAPQVQEKRVRKPRASKPKGRSPRDLAEAHLVELWREQLQLEDVATNERFFDMGGTSLKAIQFIGKMGQELNLSIPMVALFQAPTVSEFVSYLMSNFAEGFAAKYGSDDGGRTASGDESTPADGSSERISADCDIAIIGMSARLPGAKNLEEFWDMLRSGRKGVRFLTDDELRAAGVDEETISDPNYVKAVAAMDDVEGFDANFFGMLRREVELMDPQHRVILEGAWTALEHAGYAGELGDLAVGVYAGVARDAYFTSNMLTHPNLQKLSGDYSLMIGNEKDFPATRVAYKLNLHGPALSVQTACSSSGVGIHLAAQSLALGDCDMALAGGCRVLVPVAGYTYVEGGTLSPDGHVRAFDAKGRGMIRGTGVCFVVLKRLERALRDGDTIYGVIKATSVNNDGNAKVGFAAPSVKGQSEVITRALKKAKVHPETIDYIETHGTATAIGDPIEMAALTDAYRRFTTLKGYCAIGSVKTNVGHLDAGSCTAGLIKTVLAMREGFIPASLNFEVPNPQIDFASTPFFVNQRLRPWEVKDRPRRAGVSSFGLGGTNVHLIVEEAPEVTPTPDGSVETLLLSAKTESALQALSLDLARFIEKPGAPSLPDTAYTLQVGRKQFEYRRSVTAVSIADAVQELRKPEPLLGKAFSKVSDVVFMFSGQGSQHVNMGLDLYRDLASFRAFVDECCEAFKPHLDLDLREILYPKPDAREHATKLLNQTQLAQPALFTMGYAIAHQLMEWGITPTSMVGHSVGEYAAACIAGIFSLEDAAVVLSARGKLMQSMPPGSMRALRMPESEVASLLTKGVSLAACNAPALCVVSGDNDAIQHFDQHLQAKGLASVVLHTSHAFHSRMMDPILEPFGEVVARVARQKGAIPIQSTATGIALSDEQVSSVKYWVEQLRNPVLFSRAFTELAKNKNAVFIECGPNTALTVSARAHLEREEGRRVINALPHVSEARSSTQSLHGVLGKYWSLGGQVDWDVVREGASRRRVGLPPYPFERERCWIAPFKSKEEKPEGQATLPASARSAVVGSNGREDAQLSGGGSGSTGVVVGSAARPQVAALIQRQVELMSHQLALLTSARRGVGPSLNPVQPGVATATDAVAVLGAGGNGSVQRPTGSVGGGPPVGSASFAPSAGRVNGAPIAKADGKPRLGSSSGLSAAQLEYLASVTTRYNQKTQGSKAFADKHRPHLADPRVVSGFKPQLKELVYPIVVNRSLGSKLWDVDGNEYVDMLNGFGSNFFGHRAPFVIEAVQRQFAEGLEIGPQHPLAGELALELSEYLGHDRVAFCNTGSEAVLGTMRMARAATGRDLIAMFAGSYHGIFDEVIVRGTKTLRSVPAAPGIQPGAVSNILVLDYATDASFRALEERAGDLAAILVEPVQSSNPKLQPREYLHRLRDLATRTGVCLAFDEVVTGFRVGRQGAQGYFGVTADLAAYGKVLGGGLNIGVIAGKRTYMDTLDGGQWRFGDDSVPEVGVTYFAGTFVRHPPALAAAQAVIKFLKSQPEDFREKINQRAHRLVAEVNDHAARVGAPLVLSHFTSVIKAEYTKDFPLSELLYVLLRENGVHIWDHRPMSVTAAHTDEDVSRVIAAFKSALDEMRRVGILPSV